MIQNNITPTPVFFTEQFKQIVNLKTQLRHSAAQLNRLQGWDKNGSHNQAILAATLRHNQLKIAFNAALNGHDYLQWLATAKKLSAYKSRLKQINKAKVHKENNIINLINNFYKNYE